MIVGCACWISNRSPTLLLLFENWESCVTAFAEYPQPHCVANHYYSVVSPADALVRANGPSDWRTKLNGGQPFVQEDITFVSKLTLASHQEYIDQQKASVLPQLKARRGESAADSGPYKRGTAAFELGLMHPRFISIYYNKEAEAASSDAASIRRKRDDVDDTFADSATIPKKRPALQLEAAPAPQEPDSALQDLGSGTLAPLLDARARARADGGGSADDDSPFPSFTEGASVEDADNAALEAELEAASLDDTGARLNSMQTELDETRKVLDDTKALVTDLQSRILYLEQVRSERPLPDQSAIGGSQTRVSGESFANMESTMQAVVRAVFESGTLVILNFPVLMDETHEKLKEAITSLFVSAGMANEAEQISSVSRTSDTVQRAFAIKLRFKRNEALESCLLQAKKFHPDSWKSNPMGSTERDFYDRLNNIHSHVLKKAADEAKATSQQPHVHNRGHIFLRREGRSPIAPHLLHFLTTLHHNQQRQAKGSGSSGSGRGGGRGHRPQSAAPVDTFK